MEFDIDLSLRRVVVGFRVVGAVWLAILGVVALASSEEADRPAIIIITIAATSAWAALTVWLHFNRADTLRNPWFLVADVAVGAGAQVAPIAAGSTQFAGGYPLSSVFLVVYGAGAVAALGAAVVLTIVTSYRQIITRGLDLTSASANLVVFVFSAASAAWAFGIMRRADARRQAAEAAMRTAQEARTRAEERSDMAAHLHDSVLQTLALIQRQADDGRQVKTLARQQERELREWLFGGSTPAPGHLVDEVQAMAADIERRYGVEIDVVAVGDCELTEELRALVRATGEATTNAARHSGDDNVSIYIETAADTVTIFVRDRGAGFDMEQVGADRHGLDESIVGRMQRHGGTAVVRTDPGQGTEVELRMSR